MFFTFKFTISIIFLLLIFFPFRVLTWDWYNYNFETDNLADEFNIFKPSNSYRCGTCGRSSSWGLKSELVDSNAIEKEIDNPFSEVTFQFDFNANSAVITSSNTLKIFQISNENWNAIAGIWMVQGSTGGYELRFEYSVPTGYELPNGWHSLSFVIKHNVSETLYVDGSKVLERSATHAGQKIYAMLFGVIQLWNSGASGSFYYDNIIVKFPDYYQVYVDCDSGSDSNDGRSESSPFRTISYASQLVSPGGSVTVLPSTCRESFWPLYSGSSASNPTVYQARDGSETVHIRGSETIPLAQWHQATAGDLPDVNPAIVSHIYYADLSSWTLTDNPLFVMDDRQDYEHMRLPMARYPNWKINVPWKYAEPWATANGAYQVENCDTSQDSHCDTLSFTTLMDTNTFGSICDLTGAIIRMIDGYQGHYYYKRNIVSHNTGTSTIQVDEDCSHDGNPGIGRFTKYYVEGKQCLLDEPGEWWFDKNGTQRIYVWPPDNQTSTLPHLEISRFTDGIILSDKSYITIKDFTVEFFNGKALTLENWTGRKSSNLVFDNLHVAFADVGIQVEASYSGTIPDGIITQNIYITNSKFEYLDSRGAYTLEWWDGAPSASSYQRNQLINVFFDNNEFYNLSFKCNELCYDNAVGISFGYANYLRFTNNHVHVVAHNGVQVSSSILKDNQILTGHVLIEGNVIEKACRMHCDCASLKFWGTPPNNHKFKDILVTNNVFANTIGWSYCALNRYWWTITNESEIQGQGGFGEYLDYATGITSFRNIFFNNAYAGYYVGATYLELPIYFYNNLIVGSGFGISLGGTSLGDGDTKNYHGQNNIFARIEIIPISIGHFSSSSLFYDFTFDWFALDDNQWNENVSYHSLLNTWSDFGTVRFLNLTEMQNQSNWGHHSKEVEINFVDYNSSYYDRYAMNSIPDFHLTLDNPELINTGNSQFPQSFLNVLSAHGKDLGIYGSSIDFGPYEYYEPSVTGDDNSKVNSVGIAVGVILGVSLACFLYFCWCFL
ncbi:pectate lyase (eurofung) [Anaeramoeba ignava]|uniref:Pectate lyase (Eurofung) n=1 Tax=Anaeramoeba ignava TaxID=1746090 RepID=A0A9Q0LDM9_ANAIG|nr:pectate lyase (eurofung) [Anaeramoeba ignava]